jgi:hypothetical protein
MAVSGGPELQLKLVSLSTRGKQVRVNGGLNIPFDEATNAVVDAVRAVISEIRMH